MGSKRKNDRYKPHGALAITRLNQVVADARNDNSDKHALAGIDPPYQKHNRKRAKRDPRRVKK